jgi:hypothetical protein
MSTLRFVDLKLNQKKYEKVFTTLDGYVSDNFIVASIFFTKSSHQKCKNLSSGYFCATLP